MQWIDTHAHLSDPKLLENLDAVLARASHAGVTRMIAVGVDALSSHACVKLANQHQNVFASVGVHPNYGHETHEGDWDQIVSLCREPKVVALGETGLDLYWKDCPWEIQIDFLQRHAELSRETQLPLILHMRECEAELVQALRNAASHGPIRGVMHSFAGSHETAMQCLELGMYISFAGMVTYKKATDLRAIASQVPSNRLLLETDCPYLSPEPHRSKRPNEPGMLIHTAQCVAQARGMEISELAKITTENAMRLFSRLLK